jgi:putative redox protein
MYANRKDWDLGELEVRADYTGATADSPARFKVDIRSPAELTDEQQERLLAIAHKCPVHRALLGSDVEVDDSLELVGI